MKRSSRKFVGTMRRERQYNHIKQLTEQALNIAMSCYIRDNKDKPIAANMLFFILALMVHLATKLPLETIMAQPEKYKKQMGTMGGILLMEWEYLDLSIPSEFPFTLAEFKTALEDKA